MYHKIPIVFNWLNFLHPVLITYLFKRSNRIVKSRSLKLIESGARNDNLLVRCYCLQWVNEQVRQK